MQKRAFLDAMKKTFGNITSSCQAAGIKSRQTPYNWAKKDKAFKKAFESDEYEESLLDAVESKINKLALKDENPQILMFLAKTKGKKRGFVERQELTGADGKELNNTITIEMIDRADQVEADPQDETNTAQKPEETDGDNLPG